jgi:hypothetical protein
MTEGHEPLAEKWRRFRKRPPEDRMLIFRAALILPLTKIGLRLFGFQRWKNLIEKFSLPAHLSQSLPADVQRETVICAVRAVRSVELHGPTSPTCLERSMTLWWMLRRAGVDGELHIGGRKTQGRFEAHAWVEWDGQVLNDSTDIHKHYARFAAPIVAGEGNLCSAGVADSQAARKAGSRAAGKTASQ